jgi:uncharacterized protein (DUF2267 family)
VLNIILEFGVVDANRLSQKFENNKIVVSAVVFELSVGISSLDRAVQIAILWLNDIQAELQWEDREVVYKTAKAVLQTIRDRLPYEELFHFSTNLPIVFKGMLFDGYNPTESAKYKAKTLQEFYELIQLHYDPTRQNIIGAQEATFAVINTLFNKIGEGEMKKVADTMPQKLKPLFQHRSKPFSTEKK